MFRRIGQFARKDLPQPCGQNFRSSIPQIEERNVRPQHRLLDHIGNVQLPLQPPVEMQPGEDLQITSKRFERIGDRRRFSHSQLPQIWKALILNDDIRAATNRPLGRIFVDSQTPAALIQCCGYKK